jgi:hypothetical protein
MRGTVLYGPRDVRFEERPDPTIVVPTDAIIRISATCVCGSDLWPYRGISATTEPTPMGHEYCGIVEEVGRDVTSIRRTGVPAGLRESKEVRMSMAWSREDMRRIAESDDLHISPFREDGSTYGTPTWIWSVVVDGGLYVRAYNGADSRWYRAAMKQKAGRIIVADMTKEVTFEPVGGPINDRIDDAYSVKYRGSPYLQPMISDRARAATVRIIPT